MAYEIDAHQELGSNLTKAQVRATNKLIGPDSSLSPGDESRAAAALDTKVKWLKAAATAEINRPKGQGVDQGVRFYNEPAYSKPVRSVLMYADSGAAG